MRSFWIMTLATVFTLAGAPLAGADAVDFFTESVDEEPAQPTAARRPAPAALPAEQQAALYRELFAAEEAAADSSREQLELAQHLVVRAQEEELAPIRDHLYRRAMELAEGHRRRAEGLQVLLTAHQGLHAGAAFDRAMITERIAIVEDLLRKVRGPDQLPLIAELQTLLGELAVNALAAEDYAQAIEDYEALARILAKTGDRAAANDLKNLVRAIDDAADRAADIAELRPAVSTDPKAALEVGRYDLARGDYEPALASLAHAGVDGRVWSAAASVALEMAAGTALGLDQLQVLADAIAASRHQHAALQRRVLALGIELRDRLAAEADKITALRLQAMADGWDQAAEHLGPDPLLAVSLAGGVSEAQLLRMGWKSVFDHRSVPGNRSYPQTDDLSVRVLPSGVLEMRVGKDQLAGLSGLEELARHRQGLIRFRVLEHAGKWDRLGFSVRGTDANDAYRVHTGGRFDKLQASAGFQSEFGSLPLAAADEWNDLVFTFAGRQVVAELNGETFTPGTLQGPASRLSLWVKTSDEGLVVLEIQSILYRD